MDKSCLGHDMLASANEAYVSNTRQDSSSTFQESETAAYALFPCAIYGCCWASIAGEGRCNCTRRVTTMIWVKSRTRRRRHCWVSIRLMPARSSGTSHPPYSQTDFSLASRASV